MALSPNSAAWVALNRFAYGARGGGLDVARAASDPRGFLKAELQQPAILVVQSPSLCASSVALQEVYAEQQQKKMERETAPAPQATHPNVSEARHAGDEMKAGTSKSMDQPIAQKIFRAEALARFRCVAQAEVGFVERLVHFWSNHFCVSALKGPVVRASAGAFEREAIRPHVLGRFRDMLLAVEKHPTMLFYLDNAQSFGPNSSAGQRRNRGLNENLAREILELHTLGVDGGYTQTDVTALARIITGWTLVGRQGRLGEPGTFVFIANAHEPGSQRLLGKTYPWGGVEQGEAALVDLARHSATALHIARRLARHFVSDDAPQSLVDRLAKEFRESDGDLKRVAIALVDADEAWSPATSKVRTPYEFMMASTRAIDRLPDDPGGILGPLTAMGMPLWQPPGPNGWPDTVAAWASPEGMKSRLEVSAAIAKRLRDVINPSELLDTIVGEAASAETRQAVARAESREQGLALLLMSPEFQRR